MCNGISMKFPITSTASVTSPGWSGTTITNCDDYDGTKNRATDHYESKKDQHDLAHKSVKCWLIFETLPPSDPAMFVKDPTSVATLPCEISGIIPTNSGQWLHFYWATMYRCLGVTDLAEVRRDRWSSSITAPGFTWLSFLGSSPDNNTCSVIVRDDNHTVIDFIKETHFYHHDNHTVIDFIKETHFYHQL